jgi:phenylalanyl-tRNA synthetase alpha chain
VKDIQDVTKEELLQVQNMGTHKSTVLSDLSKRKLIERKKIFYFSVAKGEDFTLDIRKQETDINIEMLQTYLPHEILRCATS